jgi:hypothetical protein
MHFQFSAANVNMTAVAFMALFFALGALFSVETGNDFRRIGGYWYRKTFFRYNFLYLFQYVIVSSDLYCLISYIHILKY